MRRSFWDGNGRLGRELRPGGSVELNRQAEQVATTFGDPPASRARHLGYQLANCKRLRSAHRGTGTSLEASLLWIAEQRFSDVGVAKTTRDVVAIQHGHEQPHVFAPCGIETGITPTLDHLGLGELPQLLVGRAGSSTTANASR